MDEMKKLKSNNKWNKLFEDLEKFDMTDFLNERIQPPLYLNQVDEKKLQKLQKVLRVRFCGGWCR